MYLSLVLLPLLSAFLGFLGQPLGATGVKVLTTSAITITAIFSLVAFYEVALSGSPVTLTLGEWAFSPPLDLHWGFTFDSLTVSMLVPVLVVSSSVHLYSCSYMEHDPHVQRFFSYLSLFTASMVILVTGDSYLLTFLGWEWIGVASYLLIGFWFTRSQASKAATQAMTVNRLGDTVLTIGFFTLLWSTGAVDYATALPLAPSLPESLVFPLALLLFGGAMSKSAQVPLHTWLPSAMEGPTPVSALIHAATLVTAGVYLMLRSSPLLECAPTALVVIAFFGALTALFAASVGLVQNDLKRVIAYSTCSQLGYLFMGVGLSQYSAALFHLVGHAFFKALLFLAAGAVIHGMADQQDLRRLGGLVSFLPYTYTAMLVGSLALIALPWLSGFYSKDALVELAGAQYGLPGTVCYWVGTISAGLTAFYSFRLAGLAFFGAPAAPRLDYGSAHEAPLLMALPLALLSVLAIVFGYLGRDLYLGLGTDYLSTALPQHTSNVSLVEAEFALPQAIKQLPAILSIGGALLATYLYNLESGPLDRLTSSALGRRVYAFLNGRWGIDTVVTAGTILPSAGVGLVASKVVDRGLLELAGPHGLSLTLSGAGNTVAQYDTGMIPTYALSIMLGALSLLVISFAPLASPVLQLDLGVSLICLMGIITAVTL